VAIAFLCSIYGLRGKEIRTLTLEDFNWIRETFTVRRAKSGRFQEFPIQFEVGEIILRYLQEARPACRFRQLFVTLKPPYRPLHQVGVQRYSIGMRLRQIRLTLAEKSGGFQSHRCAMKLSEGIEQYVACKRQGGLLYTATEYGLTSFKRKVGDVELNELTSDDVLIYLSGPRTSPISWRKKHQQMSQFFIFCSDRGHLTASPMPPVGPMVRQMFVPYIYCQEEIRLLLRATTKSQADRRCLIASQTLRTLLLFLYGTGSTRSEALELRVSDVNITSFQFVSSQLVQKWPGIPTAWARISLPTVWR
jgi:integrase